MSKLHVRDVVSHELASWCTANGVEFVPAINEENKATTELWCTLEFFTDYNESDCYEGNDRTEQGTFDVTIFTPAGSGYSVAVDKCDLLEQYFWHVHLVRVEIVDSVSASEINGGDGSGRFAGWTVSFSYNHHYTI